LTEQTLPPETKRVIFGLACKGEKKGGKRRDLGLNTIRIHMSCNLDYSAKEGRGKLLGKASLGTSEMQKVKTRTRTDKREGDANALKPGGFFGEVEK